MSSLNLKLYSIEKLSQAPDFLDDVITNLENASEAVNQYQSSIERSGFTKRTTFYNSSATNILSGINSLSTTAEGIQNSLNTVISAIKNNLLSSYDTSIQPNTGSINYSINNFNTTANKPLGSVVGATVVDTFQSLLLGVVDLGEGLYDGAVMGASAIGVAATKVFGGTNSNDKVQNIKNWAQNTITNSNWSTSISDAVDSTKAGAWIATNSAIHDTKVGNAIQSAGTWIGIAAIGTLTGGTGSALLAGMYGFGSGASTAFDAGGTYEQALKSGAKKAIIDAYIGYGVGNAAKGLVSGFSGSKYTLTRDGTNWTYTKNAFGSGSTGLAINGSAVTTGASSFGLGTVAAATAGGSLLAGGVDNAIDNSIQNGISPISQNPESSSINVTTISANITTTPTPDPSSEPTSTSNPISTSNPTSTSQPVVNSNGNNNSGSTNSYTQSSSSNINFSSDVSSSSSNDDSVGNSTSTTDETTNQNTENTQKNDVTSEENVNEKTDDNTNSNNNNETESNAAPNIKFVNVGPEYIEYPNASEINVNPTANTSTISSSINNVQGTNSEPTYTFTVKEPIVTNAAIENGYVETAASNNITAQSVPNVSSPANEGTTNTIGLSNSGSNASVNFATLGIGATAIGTMSGTLGQSQKSSKKEDEEKYKYTSSNNLSNNE